MTDNIYPLTIVRDRYCGSYSGGKYIAFNLESPDVPKEVFGDDGTAMKFWKHCKLVVGVGGSPDSAVKDLANNLRNKHR